MSNKAGHVFVSHSSDNRELATELAAFLEARGLRVWIAPRDVRPGMDYSEELQLAIENSCAFIVLVTDMANKSPYVRAETEMAFSGHKPIFPVRTSDLQPAPGLAFFLKIRHWTDAFGKSRSDNLDRLVRELQALSAAAAPPGQAADPAAAAAPATLAPAPAPPPPTQPPAAAAGLMAGSAPPSGTAAPAGPALPTAPEDEETWRAAVGKNADLYLQRWRTMEAKGSALSWNWPACLVNLFWFGYRKMWLPMVGVIVAMVLFALVGGAAGDSGGTLAFLLSIALSFATGAFGNLLYRKQTGKLVADTSALPRAAQLDALRSRGGVSVPALAILLAVFGGLTFLAILGAAVQQAQQDQLNSYQTYPPVDSGATDTGTADPAADGEKPPIDESETGYYPEDY
jgi:hypothetical protein